MYLVSLYFDEDTNKILNRYIRMIAEKSGNSFMEDVLYAMPVMNKYLQDSMNIVYGELCDIPETKIYKYYKPMSWLPHITLGKKLTKEQMQRAISVMQDNFVPLTATVAEIGLARVNPHEDIMRFLLK